MRSNRPKQYCRALWTSEQIHLWTFSTRSFSLAFFGYKNSTSHINWFVNFVSELHWWMKYEKKCYKWNYQSYFLATPNQFCCYSNIFCRGNDCYCGNENDSGLLIVMQLIFILNYFFHVSQQQSKSQNFYLSRAIFSEVELATM